MDGYELVCVVCRVSRLTLDSLVLECGCVQNSGTCGGCGTLMEMTAVKGGCEMHSDGE